MTQIITVETNILQEILKRLDNLSRDVKMIKKNATGSMPMVDEKTEKRIGESLKAYKDGKYTILKTDGDIKKFIANL